MALSLPSCSFFSGNDRDSTERSTGKWRYGRLHPDFDRFKRAKKNISDQLGRSAGSEIKRRLVAIRSIFSGEIRVKLLKELISPVLERALGLR